ncbi:insulin-like peptide receptor isoform X2 [Cylas formicarius]|uniref:insulin-like peptide receptor isoform X2 n=1 Tax=Cylas formicarius TaxID=197179 RepID=UPI0029589103|nr:insulin-like peptide receptor isoform X2 [Cylas formicarius]
MRALRKSFVILNAFTLFAIMCVYTVEGKVCHTTDVRNSVRNLNKLRGCNVIAGNLKIVLLERTSSPSDFDDYVFPELTKITGYLLFFRVKYLSSIGKLFPNLRVIRGVELIANYAFIAFEMPHLKEIGLTKLMYMARGFVRVSNSPLLCFADTIDWRAIGPLMHYINLNKKDCPPCPARCEGHCWNLDQCQEVPNQNCHIECLGCSKENSSRHCHTCKNFNDHGTCVDKCPPHTYTNWISFDCLTEEECFNFKKNAYWTFGDTCVNDCPPRYESIMVDGKKSCRLCDSSCVRYCKVSNAIETLNELQKFKGCTHINGSLVLKLAAVGGHSEQILEELKASLGLVRYVRDYLIIGRMNSMKDLRFLENLTTIEGQNLTNNRALFIYENQNLQKLWDFDAKNFSLNILNGTIAFHNNPYLCISEIQRLKKMTNVTYTSMDVSFYSNGDKAFNCGEEKDSDMVIDLIKMGVKNVTLTWKRRKTDNVLYYNVYYIVVPISYHSVNLTWDHPRVTNGILERYNISVNLMAHNKIERDYCRHPMTPEGEKTDKDDFMEEDEETEEVVPSKLDECQSERKPQSEEIDFVLLIHKHLHLCDKNSQSKYGYDQCNRYVYDTGMGKRADGSSTYPQARKSLYAFPDNPTLQIDYITANSTYHVLENLQHFSDYLFYMRVCNKKVDERDLCSPILSDFVRTYPKPGADDIPHVDVSVTLDGDNEGTNNVTVSWQEPRNPNSAIISYYIQYYRESEHSQPESICVSRETYLKERKHVIRNLIPGQRYYLKLHAVSWAGPGNYTKEYKFDIRRPGTNPFWTIFVVTLFLLLAIVFVLLYLRYKKKYKLSDVHLIASVNPDYAGGAVYIEDQWEMERSDIDIQKLMGKGSFGIVYYGKIISKEIPCAVKTVHENASVQDKADLFTEVSIMKSFSGAHHVVKLLGVVSRGHPPLVIMEMMERGDLKEYLRTFRDSSQDLTVNEIYRMAIEIADGMGYLSAKKFVHRDLAARNIMVAGDRTVKIGDFGMTRDIYETDYYRKGTSGRLPVRWMAPESLADGVFTSDSDVWSYGIVLWEIATLAEQPYQGYSNEQVLQLVVKKGCLRRPPQCPDMLYEIMYRCWEWKPYERPTFFDIVERLEKHVGLDFKFVSFYHSREGEEYRITAGRERVHNAPALLSGMVSDGDPDLSSSDDEDPERKLSDSPQQGYGISPGSPRPARFLTVTSQRKSRMSGNFY